jgi:hypothetical protein
MIDRSTDGILRLIGGDPWMLGVLRAAASVTLPDWWIGAGFVRGKVWDALHGFERRTDLADVDLIYFDPDDRRREREDDVEATLRDLRPDVPWSVRNQARMHLRNGDEPYRNCEDALRFWLETATCVAVNIDAVGRLSLIAPYGLDDLFDLVVRPTFAGRRRPEEYMGRLREKNWPGQWPLLQVFPAP